MPVTKTAKRALRSSRRKQAVNKLRVSKMEIAVRVAQKTPSENNVRSAFSMIDRAVKNHLLHKNKASRMKSKLSKLLQKPKSSTKKASKKK